MAGRGGQTVAGVTPERRARPRTPLSRRYSRSALISVVALLAVFAGVAAVRIFTAQPGPFELIAWLLIPVAAAVSLGALLYIEMQRVERAQAARSDSEQRFRMAVEAARCGIWEWDLAADQIFMSEVTASLFGWRSGLVDGQQVLERVAPGHRDDMREALSTAAIYGDFDVSFRVPPLAGARPGRYPQVASSIPQRSFRMAASTVAAPLSNRFQAARSREIAKTCRSRPAGTMRSRPSPGFSRF